MTAPDPQHTERFRSGLGNVNLTDDPENPYGSDDYDDNTYDNNNL